MAGMVEDLRAEVASLKEQVSHGLQQQSLWKTSTAVS